MMVSGAITGSCFSIVALSLLHVINNSKLKLKLKEIHWIRKLEETTFFLIIMTLNLNKGIILALYICVGWNGD